MTVEPTAASRPATSPGRGADRHALDWVSQLPSAAAPGFVYLAGACRGIPVGGGGTTLAEAEGRLAGEAAEVLAQTAQPVPSDAPGLAALDAAWTDAAAPLRVRGRDAVSGRTLGVPAAAIFLGGRAAAERRPSAPTTSLGLAAGPEPAAARLAGLLELIERDAAARWWCEGARPRQLDAAALATPAADIARLRSGTSKPRPTGFLALASPTGVPVVCAVSADHAGRGMAFGFKAAADPAVAAAGALIELLQMELALEMARHRAGGGIAAAGDAGPLARAKLVPEDFAAFAALPPAVAAPIPSDFSALAALLVGQGLAVVAADLPGWPGGLAVAKVFVPGLRQMPGGERPVVAGTPGAIAPLM